MVEGLPNEFLTAPWSTTRPWTGKGAPYRLSPQAPYRPAPECPACRVPRTTELFAAGRALLPAARGPKKTAFHANKKTAVAALADLPRHGRFEEEDRLRNPRGVQRVYAHSGREKSRPERCDREIYRLSAFAVRSTSGGGPLWSGLFELKRRLFDNLLRPSSLWRAAVIGRGHGK